jgi:mRNA-degrading endonuclease RelE of RelBE toxin-antitoxin system
MRFKVEFTTRAVKDLKSLSLEARKTVLKESIHLETAPFPFKNRIKRIQGIKFPCYRLQVDRGSNSYRIFYGMDGDAVYILRIVLKKDADKIIKRIQDVHFPPNTSK